MSVRCVSLKGCASLPTRTATAVFSPAKEKSRLGLPSSGRGRSNASARPCSASARQRRPTGVTQAEQLGALVEGLAGGVVDGLAQHRVAPHAIDTHQLRVSARDEQRDERELRRIGRQERRQQVPFQVVHAQRRLAQRGRQGHRHAGTDQQRTGQPRPARVGHQVDVLQGATGVGQHLARQRQHAADVVARGQFGHHAAVGLVHVHLAVQRLRQQLWNALACRVDQRDAGLVAGALDAQHLHRRVSGSRARG